MKIKVRNFNASGNDINLEFTDKIVCFCGHSGSGKSSILHMIHGLRNYDGECDVINSVYMPQSFRLFDHMSLVENIFINQKVDLELMNKYLYLYQIDSRRDVSSMSGGEKQRICFIRSIVTDAKVLLLDEPTSALDDQNTEITSNILKDLTSKYEHIIVSTHDMNFARKISSKHIMFKNNKIDDIILI